MKRRISALKLKGFSNYEVLTTNNQTWVLKTITSMLTTTSTSLVMWCSNNLHIYLFQGKYHDVTFWGVESAHTQIWIPIKNFKIFPFLWIKKFISIKAADTYHLFWVSAIGRAPQIRAPTRRLLMLRTFSSLTRLLMLTNMSSSVFIMYRTEWQLDTTHLSIITDFSVRLL